MKFYRIGMYSNPTAEKIMAMKKIPFAYYSVVGPWVDIRPKCDVCGFHWQTYGNPLEVEWEVSSDQIGDFSWHGPFGVCPALVKKTLAKVFQNLGFDCKYKEVIYTDHHRKRNIVPFPYRGPELVSFTPCPAIELDLKNSAVKIESSCEVCGYVRHTPRMEGLVIQKKNWNGENMFHLSKDTSQGSTIFVTEEGCKLIEQNGFTNICFTEAGKIVK